MVISDCVLGIIVISDSFLRTVVISDWLLGLIMIMVVSNWWIRKMVIGIKDWLGMCDWWMGTAITIKDRFLGTVLINGWILWTVIIGDWKQSQWLMRTMVISDWLEEWWWKQLMGSMVIIDWWLAGYQSSTLSAVMWVAEPYGVQECSRLVKKASTYPYSLLGFFQSWTFFLFLNPKPSTASY